MPFYSVLDSRDIKGFFLRSVAEEMEKNWATDIGGMVGSDRATEEYNWLGHVPQMREFVGGRQEIVLNKYAYSLTNKVFELTLPFDIEDLKNDKTGNITTRIADAATRTVTHWNSLISTLTTNGEAGTSGLAYDGQFYFDTDHNESGSNQTNDLTSTEVPAANVSNADAPTAVEAASIIVETVGHLMSLTDDQGQPINQGARSFRFMVGNSQYWSAFQNAIANNNLASGQNSVAVGLKNAGFDIQVIFNSRLSATADKVYCFIADGMARPFILQEQSGVETDVQAAGSHGAFWNNRYVFGVKAVRNAGFGFWQKAAVVALS